MDITEMWDGPLRFSEVISICAGWLALLLLTTVFWRARSGWLRRPPRFLWVIAAFFTFVGPLMAYQRGLAWPTGDPASPWLMSAWADLLFTIGWPSIAVVAVIAVRRLALSIFPPQLLQPDVAPTPHMCRSLTLAARTGAVLMCIPTLMLLTGMLLDGGPRGGAERLIAMVAAAYLTALLLGLRWHLAGGIGSIAATVLIPLLQLPPNSLWPVLCLPGILYIASWRSAQRCATARPL